MEKYNLVIAWEWEYDSTFVHRLNDRLIEKGLSCFLIDPNNLDDVLHRLKNKLLGFDMFLDRASDADERFLPLADFLNNSKSCQVVNPIKYVWWSQDKANMHLEFLAGGVDIPYSLILCPQHNEAHLPEEFLEKLSNPFVVKPANGGGGEGVVASAKTIKDVAMARQYNTDQKYLLQEKIYPDILDGKRAWFRVFYVFGKAIPCWWDDHTKIYQNLTLEDERKFKLGKLRTIAKKVGKLSKMNFFSTELCVTKDKRFVCVDYVNDPCDMRYLSETYDGVPDEVIGGIIEQIIVNIAKRYTY